MSMNDMTLGLTIAAVLLVALAVAFLRRGGREEYLKRLQTTLRRERGELRLRDNELVHDLACVDCPKFARFPARCTVPFGSPIRKCITASVEYHLRDTAGRRVLEIGCGSSSHAKAVVEYSGGEWIGLDPYPGRVGHPSVRTVGGVVQSLPFRDASFDIVCGVQTLEHWEDRTYPFGGLGYQSVINEVWRVLKPGGWVYFDAPIHVHGAPEFIRGDLPAIRGIFAHHDWRNVRMISWRRLHAPLKPRRPPKA